ncbi:hypothetical protein C8Q73DRAFT_385115 [Cubamyces lactineus]|nr:hypothetical protein C8Q73DRAFT_385115 [Cubamyces lactineus]
MPWRVGRELRHLYHAAHALLERSRTPWRPICLIAKPIHSTRAPWQPAVALKLKHSHTAVQAEGAVEDLQLTPSYDLDVESVLLRWKRPREVEAVDPEIQPPPHILAILDNVFKQYRTRLPTLEELRSSPDTAELVTYLRSQHRPPALVHHFLDVREPRHALWIIRIAVQSGYSFSPKFYGHVSEKLADMHKWRLITGLTDVARADLGYTTTGLLNWRLQALMESQHHFPLQDVLDLYAREHVRVSRLTYHLLIAMHLRNHDLTTALAVVRAMESAGIRVSPRTWAVILLNHRSLGLSPSAKAQALSALRTADGQTATTILNSLVQLLLDAHDMTGAIDVLSMASVPNAGHLSDHGVGTTQPGDAKSDSALSSPRSGLINVTTYNILLNYLARQGDLARSLQTLEQMDGAAILPDDATAAALVRLYYATDSPNDALHVVADALRNYPTAAALLLDLGFTASMPAKHPTYPNTAAPTIGLFNSLITGILRSSGLAALNTVLRIMRIVKVDANAATLAILMSHLNRREKSRPREMIRAVRALMSIGLPPTTRHLHVLMAALLREERAISRPRGWTMGPVAEQTSLRPFAAGNCFEPAAGVVFPRRLRYRSLMRPILQSLTDRGVRSDRVTFAMRIKHDAVVKCDLEMALSTFKAMVAAGIQPNEYHYGALIEGHAAVGDMRGAMDIMCKAAEAGARINVKTHTMIIAGFARLGQPTQAVEAFRRMVGEGIRPDVPAIDALVSAFFRAKAYRVARRALLQLWPQVAPMSDELEKASLRQLAIAFRALHGANSKVPERLSSQEQRMLRWKIRDILRRWKSAEGYSRDKGERAHRPARHRHVSLARTPEYTRARRC